MIEEKKCLECGDPIKGRIDKKFCSDQCRNTFNNRQNSDEVNYVRNINHILRKNRKILESLNPKGIAKVSKQQMVNKGFVFDYFTHIYTTKTDKNTYIYCYDYGYRKLENDEYLIVIDKKKDD
jgi:predicted nucleic acid-binding Zn ribbon protein